VSSAKRLVERFDRGARRVVGRVPIRAKEHGAFATPHGRPRKPRHDAPDGSANHTGAGNDPDTTAGFGVKQLPELIHQAGTET